MVAGNARYSSPASCCPLGLGSAIQISPFFKRSHKLPFLSEICPFVNGSNQHDLKNRNDPVETKCPPAGQTVARGSRQTATAGVWLHSEQCVPCVQSSGSRPGRC